MSAGRDDRGPLAQRRVRLGLTLRAAAERTGVDHVTVHRLEHRGHRPQPRTVLRVAHGLGMDPVRALTADSIWRTTHAPAPAHDGGPPERAA